MRNFFNRALPILKRAQGPASAAFFLSSLYIGLTDPFGHNEKIAQLHVSRFKLFHHNEIEEARRIDEKNGNTLEMDKWKKYCVQSFVDESGPPD